MYLPRFNALPLPSLPQIFFSLSFIVSSFSSGKVDEKATQLHAIASLKVLLDATKPQDGANGSAGGAGGGAGPGGPIADGDAHDSGRASQGTEVRPGHITG